MSESNAKIIPDMNLVTEKVRHLLSAHLKISHEEIDTSKKLASYGVDSIDSFTILGDLEEWLNIELPSTLLWDCSNLNELSEYIVSNFDNLTA